MLTETKKERERRHFEQFRGACSDLPEGEWLHRDCPDFRHLEDPAGFGIELTSLYRGSERNKVQEQESLQRQVLSTAERRFEAMCSIPVIVSCDWNGQAVLRRSNVGPLAKEIVDLAMADVPAPDRIRPVDARRLPPELRKIEVARFDCVRRTSWLCSYADWPTDCSIEQIQKAIDKKSLSLLAYRLAVAQIWLVMVIDDLLPSTWLEIPNAINTTVIESAFDRTMLYRRTGDLVIQLRTRLPAWMSAPAAGPQSQRKTPFFQA